MAIPQVLTFFKDFTTNAQGNIFLTGAIDIKEFDRVNLEIIQFPSSVPNITVSVTMGKISGSTLAQKVASFTLGSSGTIQTFNVIGPEMSVVLQGGPPNTVVSIQAWLFLH